MALIQLCRAKVRAAIETLQNKRTSRASTFEIPRTETQDDWNRLCMPERRIILG